MLASRFECTNIGWRVGYRLVTPTDQMIGAFLASELLAPALVIASASLANGTDPDG